MNSMVVNYICSSVSHTVLASDSQPKGSNTSSARSPVVDEESMRPGH